MILKLSLNIPEFQNVLFYFVFMSPLLVGSSENITKFKNRSPLAKYPNLPYNAKKEKKNEWI